MSEYHVACGANDIFAGTLNKKGDMWASRSVVTKEALDAVAYFLLIHHAKMKFECEGVKYVLGVVPDT